MATEVLLTTEEAAAVLRLEPDTLKKWRLRQTGPPFARLGRRIVYRERDLNRYIDQQFQLNS